MRVQIKPGLRQLWRGPGTVQIGLHPERGTVLDGLTAADRSLLERLRGGADPGDLTRDGGQRALSLLALLAEADVLVRARAGRAALARLGAARTHLAPDAAAWSLAHPGAGDGWELLAARTTRTVVVSGTGRTADALTAVLGSAAVGTVLRRDPPDPPDPDAEDATDRPVSAALVVLVDHDAADAARADALVATDTPHLSVVPGEAGVVVGPLVVPGRGPCLRCLDLHRTDRDPQWPAVLAQLLPPPGPARPARRQDTEEEASSTLAGALAALQVLAHLDGLSTPAALGATLEVELPHGLVARREWPAHPACGCTWPPSSGTGGRGGHRAGRMAG